MAKERNSAPRIFRTYFLADMSVSPTTARACASPPGRGRCRWSGTPRPMG
jgi:hypothetical protein